MAKAVAGFILERLQAWEAKRVRGVTGDCPNVLLKGDPAACAIAWRARERGLA